MDQTLFHLINQQRTNPALDLFMAAISNVEIWEPLIVLLALFALFAGGFKGRALVFCLVVILLVNGEITGVLKTLFDRKRPKQTERVRLVELARTHPEFLTLFKKPTTRFSDESDQHRSGPSFPSGHTTNNFAIALILAVFYRRFGWLYFFVAAAVGYSRIYLGAHWPSDVLATIFLSLGETFLLLALFEFLWRALASRWRPQLFVRHPSLVGDPVS
jgi:undecaprenyl-diphosphatase